MLKKKFVYALESLNEWQTHCFDSCGIEHTNLFTNENQIKYLFKSKKLFADKKVEFIDIELFDISNGNKKC